MDSLSFHESPQTVQSPEPQHSDRMESTDLLALLEWGAGQILEVTSNGLSFGCHYPHTLPDELRMDILGEGVHIKDIQVRKFWEKSVDNPELLTRFKVVAGVEFINESQEQSREISQLLEKLRLLNINPMTKGMGGAGTEH